LIKINQLSKTFDAGAHKVKVLENLNFHLAPSEFVTIVGRSGSGKSTILDLIMGLTKPTSGEIIHSKNQLSMGYVFQKPALLPWKTVFANVALPLEIAHVSKAERKEKVLTALSQVGMDYAAGAFPFQLSGGMAQRVAIARALVQEPDILLMDEPFSAIDPILRDNLNLNLLKLWARTRKTILFVTHSINEAVILSDRIVILEEGCFVKEFEIDIPRPRTYDTFHTRQFAQLTRVIREYLPMQPNQPRRTPE